MEPTNPDAPFENTLAESPAQVAPPPAAVAAPAADAPASDFMAKNWRDLIRPRVLEVVDRDGPYGKFACEPLERGFGITLGNSLRRVLLSSLQGAAFTHIKIEGALHEFTSLPNVVEDVTDIILNLKETLLRVDDDKSYTVRIDKEGEGIVKASDIELVTGVMVLNPDHHIATLSSGGKLHMELTVGTGRGYVPAERHSKAQRGLWIRRSD